MKCRKCKTEVNKEDTFCLNCGYRLKSKSRKFISIFLIIIAIFLILLGCYEIIEYKNSPEQEALKYFKTIITNDVDKIYPYIDKYESSFVNKELLKEKNQKLEYVKNYKVEKIEENNGYTYVYINYDMDGINTSSIIELSKKKKFIFNTYEINSGKVIKNVIFKVLKDSKITIDDKDITKYKSDKDSDEYYDAYVMPYMLSGNYNIKATLPNGIEMDKEVTLNKEGTYILSKVELDEDTLNMMKDTIRDTLNIMYENAINEKSYEDIKDNFDTDLSTLYSNVKRSLNKNIKSINFDNIKITSSTLDEEGKLLNQVLADYEFEYEVNDTSKKISRTLSIDIYFKYDESWQITDAKNGISKDTVYE